MIPEVTHQGYQQKRLLPTGLMLIPRRRLSRRYGFGRDRKRFQEPIQHLRKVPNPDRQTGIPRGRNREQRHFETEQFMRPLIITEQQGYQRQYLQLS